MIKELSLLGACLSSAFGGVRSPSTRSHEVVDDGMKIIYKYETNQPTSVDDVYEGYIYRIDFSQLPIDEGVYVSSLYLMSDGELVNSFTDADTDYLYIWRSDANIIKVGSDYLYSGDAEEPFAQFTISMYNFYVVNDSNGELNSYYNILFESDYLPIESVERVYPDNVFGFVSEFIDEHILNGIPNIDDVSSSIGGKTITLRSWLNTSICIVLAVMFILLLIWFVKYLFRLFSGLLH